jgi:hypothetical protein
MQMHMNLKNEDDISLECDDEIIDNQELQDIRNEDPGVDDEANANSGVGIEPGNDDLEVMVEDEEHQGVQKDDTHRDGASTNNGDEEASEEDDSEEESDHTHTVTRSGRQVKLRKDLYDSYVFTQHFSPSSQTPSVRETFGIHTKGTRVESPANDAML